jgi:nucleotide-binding universal stress UspA family protein
MPPRMSPNPAIDQTVAGEIEHATSDALATAARQAARSAPGLPIQTQLLPGSPAAALVERAQDAAMLVVGSRGAGLCLRGGRAAQGQAAGGARLGLVSPGRR